MPTSKSSLLKPVLNKSYPTIEFGRGSYLYTKDGRKVLAQEGTILNDIIKDNNLLKVLIEHY